MQTNYVQEKLFDKTDFTSIPLPLAEYEGCTFRGCNFSNSNLSDFKFTDCTFEDCNLSLVKSSKTALRDVVFKGCKMLGFRFDLCNTFGLAFIFTDCQLNHSSFYKLKIKKTRFKNCGLQEVDFTDCDLSASVFDNCDLLRAAFDNTNLEKADLRSAFNYSIHPETNSIKKAKFSLNGLAGLLGRYDVDIES